MRLYKEFSKLYPNSLLYDVISSNQDNFIFLIRFHVICRLEQTFFPSHPSVPSMEFIGKTIMALGDNSSSGSF